jgi:hypothetical protein
VANEPIDTSARPSMVSVACHGGCGQHIVADREYTDRGGLTFCSICRWEQIGGGNTTAVVHEKPAHWFTANNPGPPPAAYPPSTIEAYAVRVNDPDVDGRCLAHPLDSTDGDLRLMTADPGDVELAFALHDFFHHNTGDGPWLIAGNTGRTGDVCNPCAGAKWDKDQGKTVAMDGGPRHDLCLRERTRGRGGDCPCVHHRPYMKGIKPGDRDRPGAVDRARDMLAEHNKPTTGKPPEPPKPTIITGYLFDPDEEATDDDS